MTTPLSDRKQPWHLFADSVFDLRRSEVALRASATRAVSFAGGSSSSAAPEGGGGVGKQGRAGAFASCALGQRGEAAARGGLRYDSSVLSLGIVGEANNVDGGTSASDSSNVYGSVADPRLSAWAVARSNDGRVTGGLRAAVKTEGGGGGSSSGDDGAGAGVGVALDSWALGLIFGRSGGSQMSLNLNPNAFSCGLLQRYTVLRNVANPFDDADKIVNYVDIALELAWQKDDSAQTRSVEARGVAHYQVNKTWSLAWGSDVRRGMPFYFSCLAKTWADPGLQFGITVPGGPGVKPGTMSICFGMENGGAVQFESVDPVKETIKTRSAWQYGLSREEKEDIEQGKWCG